ncbi:MAG: hypothetical protein IT303_13695 [Dehalococcoidia bacterium]|nr:hypothetical protein [Dehalococcoidia bacterium]
MSGRRKRFGKLALVCLLSAFAAAWALNFIWWLLLPVREEGPETVDLVIPEGTAAIVFEGKSVPIIPTAFELAPGSKLRVSNEDTVEHEIAGQAVPAGSVATIEVPTDGGDIVCTIHPSGYLGLTLTERPGILSTIVPSLLLGVPLGVLLFLVIAIASSIQWSDDDAPLSAGV